MLIFLSQDVQGVIVSPDSTYWLDSLQAYEIYWSKEYMALSVLWTSNEEILADGI